MLKPVAPPAGLPSYKTKVIVDDWLVFSLAIIDFTIDTVLLGAVYKVVTALVVKSFLAFV